MKIRGGKIVKIQIKVRGGGNNMIGSRGSKMIQIRHYQTPIGWEGLEWIISHSIQL